MEKAAFVTTNRANGNPVIYKIEELAGVHKDFS